LNSSIGIELAKPTVVTPGNAASAATISCWRCATRSGSGT
jgi:hypothetical protein